MNHNIIDNYELFESLSLEDMIKDLEVIGSFTPEPNFNDDIEKYKVDLFFYGENISSLIIFRALNKDNLENDQKNYYFDLSKNSFISKPYVSSQNTYDPFKGKGLSGYLIKIANKIYRPFFNSPSYSDISFMDDTISDDKPAVRVWQKLTDEGVAIYSPEDGIDRWCMK